MKRYRASLIITALAASVLLAGCLGSSKSTSVSLTGGSSVADIATAVGMDKCVICHSATLDTANPADNGSTIFEQWTASKHGNEDPASHASYANFAADPTCDGARCHDPNGDGHKMAALGQAERPVVGCEACHGGGSEHFGVGPMAYPKPNATNCGQCHNATSPPAGHATYHPNAWGGTVNNPGIFEAYSASPHASSINSHVYDSAGNVVARCAKCHTDEGAKKFSLVDNVATGSAIDCAVLNPALAGATAVQCSTCHKSHGVSALLKPATGTVGTTYKSGQFNTCTACHQANPQIHNSAPYIHDALLPNRHAVGGVVPGIIVQDNSATACTECHNPHKSDVTENKQWAASGHGDNNSEAWNDNLTASTSSSYCKRCHTTSAYVVYTDNQDVAYNSPVHTAAFIANGTVKNGVSRQETLYCRGCHKVASTGVTVARRTPQAARIPGDGGSGITPANYTSTYVQIAGYGDSELCMNCHSGRLGRSGTEIAAQIQAKTTGLVSIDNIGMVSGAHNLAAVWAIFQDNTNGIGAYRLAGKNYNNPSYYAHNKIGTVLALDHSGNPLWTDNSTGPCVGCHMKSPNVADNVDTGSHSFSPVAKANDAEGSESLQTIVAVTSTTCVKCHAGQYALTASGLQATKDEFQARIAEFDVALLAQGIVRSGTSFKNAADNVAITNWMTRAIAVRDNTLGVNTVASTLATDNTQAGIDLMGVCWNLQYLDSNVGGSADAGIWAHNNIYANRLIYDAIEALGKLPSFTRP